MSREREVAINPGQIHSRVEQGVGIAEFDNPQRGYLTAHMVQELDRITKAWEKDPSVRAIVITGRRPGIFITHYSPYELTDTSATVRQCKNEHEVIRLRKITRFIVRLLQLIKRIPWLYRLIDRLGRNGPLHAVLVINQFHDMLTRWQQMDKAVIAAINGNCMGGGCEISLACDFRLMARGDYALGLPESVSAIIPGAGGSQRLARLLGANRAIELILTGQMSDADQAEKLGLISKAVEPEALMDQAMALAKQLAAQPPLSVGGVKRAILGGMSLPLPKALELESLHFMDTCISRDAARVGEYYFDKLNSGHEPRQMFAELSQGTAPIKFEGN